MSSTDAAAIPVPPELAALHQWVCWKVIERQGKPTKVPINAATGDPADSTDPDTWADLATAVRACQQHPELAGIGFVFSADDPYTGIDLDNCIDADGKVSPDAKAIILDLDSYTEISPSGRGVKVFVRATKPEGSRCRTTTIPGLDAIEVYDHGRFFTFTGNTLPGATSTINKRQQQVDELLERMKPKSIENRPVVTGPGFTGDDAALIDKARGADDKGKFDRLWNGDTTDFGGDDSAADMALCNKLAWWTAKDRDRMDRLFRQSGLMRPKWDERRGASTYGADTIEEACRLVVDCYQPKPPKNRQIAPQDDATRPVNEAEGTGVHVFALDNWLAIAEAFLGTYDIDTGQGLIFWRDEWYVFGNGAWQKEPEGTIAAAGTFWLRSQTHRKGDKIEPIPLVRKSSEELMHHLKKVARIDAPSAPCWMSGTGPDPRRLIIFRNGMIDADDAVRTGTITLLPPNPRLFSLGALPYDYDPDAKCPEFDKYLLTALPDTLSRELLQEWFGYTLIPDVSFEKMMFLEGHPSGGKGTTIVAHRAMLGSMSTTTSICDLASEFGKANLVGALAAFDPDAHLNRSTDSGRALEAIKRITGADAISVNRKNQSYLTNILITARITLAVNEFPKLPDVSDAMTRRTNIVRYQQSFLDNPDPGIKKRVEKEGQGICNWAIKGLIRLLDEGKFTVPRDSADLLVVIAEDNNPIKAYVADRCQIGDDYVVHINEICDDYRAWADSMGFDYPKNNSAFAKAIYDSVRGIKRKKWKGERAIYGIRLSPSRPIISHNRT